MKHHNRTDKIFVLIYWLLAVAYITMTLWTQSKVALIFSGYFFAFALVHTIQPSYDFWTKPWEKLVNMYSKENNILRRQIIELEKKGKKK